MNFAKFLRRPFFYRTPSVAASVISSWSILSLVMDLICIIKETLEYFYILLQFLLVCKRMFEFL